jgi:FMN phosphatase YigB (HAD superfamily)
MIKAVVFDFSRVLLFPNDLAYVGSLNELHRALREQEGYELLSHFSLNTVMLHYLSTIGQVCDLYIFTSDSIQDDPSLESYLRPVFKAVFSAKKLGIKKNSPDAYVKLAGEMGVDTQEVLFVDDTPENVHAAEAAGMNTIRYMDSVQCMEEIAQYLSQT